MTNEHKHLKSVRIFRKIYNDPGKICNRKYILPPETFFPQSKNKYFRVKKLVYSKLAAVPLASKISVIFWKGLRR